MAQKLRNGLEVLDLGIRSDQKIKTWEASMNNAAIAFRILALSAAIETTALVHQAHATVTWSFFETGIFFERDLPCGGSCALPPQPFVLATLTLSGPTSAGSAMWVCEGPPPVITNPDFTFEAASGGGLHVAPPNYGAGHLCGSRADVQFYDISWLETEGHLDSISIVIIGVNDSLGPFAPGPLGLTGGSIASDGIFGGCFDAQCTVTGFWQSDLPLPEPMSAVLLLTGLFGTWLTGYYRSASAFAKTGSSPTPQTAPCHCNKRGLNWITLCHHR